MIFKREELILAFRLDNLNASVTIDSGKQGEVNLESGGFPILRRRQMKMYLEKMHVEQIRWAYRSKTTLRLNGIAVIAKYRLVRAGLKVVRGWLMLVSYEFMQQQREQMS